MQELCETLGEFGIWVRLHYVYPYPHVDNVIPLMAEGRILPYLDVPLQHGSPEVLRHMKRPAAAEKSLDRIQAWREVCPDITLRSTFIVGFPGETDRDFEILLDFLREAQLDRVGCFQYSPVKGAKANDLPDHVPEPLKQERWDQFMAVQQEISTARLQAKIGSTVEILIDEVDERGAIGRSSADAPDIDGRVYLDGVTDLQPGDFVEAEVTGADEYDLWAG
jgi:ribosomal protein S12 methylthiotransferase